MAERMSWRRQCAPERRRQGAVWVVGFTLLLTVGPAAASSSGSPSHPGNEGATAAHAGRFTPDGDARVTQYRALRRMYARCEKFDQEGWLDAWTELADGRFQYEIVSERGSEYIRNKVLRAVLKREQELVAEGPGRAALSEENYTFAEPAGESGPGGLRYVLMKPKRKDVVLVDGRMVLSPDGGELLRIEGRLAKNPSFWTSLVHVVRHFALLDGVRVPVATESIAKVKFAGRSEMTVQYEYETINGRPVSLQARRPLPAAVPASGGGAR